MERRRVAAMFAVLLCAVGMPAPASGQRGLDAVDALAGSGRTEEARGVLETWWDGERSQSSRRDRQRGLWLRAVLTVDPEMATLDYQRLVVSYPGGPYSDGALIRLAMIAGSGEDLLGAAGHYLALLQDYPRSQERVRARQWLSEHSEELEAAEAETALVAAAVRAAADSAAAEAASKAVEIEVADAPAEVEEQTPELGKQAPGVEEQASQVEEPARADRVDNPADSAGRHSVQLGAFSTEERARGLARTVARAGFETRVVRVEGSSLVRVRIGRFTERSAATELMARIEGLGYDAAVVSDVRKEGPIR